MNILKNLNDLPSNWSWINLGDLCEFVYGKGLVKNKRNEKGKFPVYGSNGIVGFHNEYLVEGPCLIIGRKGAAGEVHLSNKNCWPIDTTYFIKQSDKYSISYLYFVIKNLRLYVLDKSTAIPGLNRNDAYKLQIPLPPLSEQNKIVSKIEELFSELDNGIELLKKAKEQLRIYRQSVLAYAFSGKSLNHDLSDEKIDRIKEGQENHVNPKIVGNPGSDNLPNGWKWVKLGEISTIGTGVTPLRSIKEYYLNGSIPWLTSGVVNDPFVYSPLEFVTEKAKKEYRLRLYPKHTLLVALYGEGKTRGKCTELMFESTINQAMAAINLNSEYKQCSKFIKWFLIKNYEEMRLLSSGGVQPNLNLTLVKNTNVPFPPINQQHQIVEEIESRISVADKLGQAIDENLKKSETLRQSILKKAFEGRLV